MRSLTRLQKQSVGLKKLNDGKIEEKKVEEEEIPVDLFSTMPSNNKKEKPSLKKDLEDIKSLLEFLATKL